MRPPLFLSGQAVCACGRHFTKRDYGGDYCDTINPNGKAAVFAFHIRMLYGMLC